MSAQVKYLDPRGRNYPACLNVLNIKPGLYVAGKLELKGQRVGIIGTRRPTAYGLRFANELAASLSVNEVTVISGFARGIDSAAHRASIEAGGKTIAVLGSGIDVIYPPENKELYSLIVKNGALLSEFKPGIPPFKQNFPRRNRLISAFSDLLVVIEATEKSGTLITVDFALEQGKEVMVLPGSVFSAKSMGTNKLIKQGAEPITKVADILEKLGIDASNQNKQLKSPLLSAMSDCALSLEELSLRLGKDIPGLVEEICRLQIEGVVKQDLGGRYYRVC